MTSLTRYLRWLDVFGVLDRTRASRQAALLSLLAIAVERQLPLSPMLDAFADDSPASWRQGVRDLSDMLQSGSSLPDALEALPELLPQEALLAARVGAESGTLADSLRSVSRRLAPDPATAVVWPRWAVLYLAVVPLVMVLVVSFMMIWIIPKFKKIFEDFAVELPGPTIALIEASDWCVNYWFMLLPPLLGLAAGAGVLVASGGRLVYPLDSPPRTILGRFPRFAAPDVLRNLGVVVRAGRPLAGALDTMAGFHPAFSTRRRLWDVSDAVENGQDCWQSMTAVGLLRPQEAALLSAAERVGNLSWALWEVARNIERQLDFRSRMVMELVRPVVVLVLGGVVGFVVVSMFLPLVKLISDVT